MQRLKREICMKALTRHKQTKRHHASVSNILYIDNKKEFYHVPLRPVLLISHMFRYIAEQTSSKYIIIFVFFHSASLLYVFKAINSKQEVFLSYMDLEVRDLAKEECYSHNVFTNIDKNSLLRFYFVILLGPRLFKVYNQCFHYRIPIFFH